ncbi:MAG TPA: dienelactone hydrolase family protein [Acidimicrobiales bacterium]|nr:dienelactone hydrolase family protein [Acidimicrobiales bacterium]
MPVVAARALAGAAALLVTVVACGSGDGGASPTTDPRPATTGGPVGEEQLLDWSARGPHGVGSQQLALDDGRRVAVWYPAEAGAGTDEPTGTFDITSLLSPELQAQVPADARPVHPVPAAPGAAPDRAAAPYPVVLFSHGFAGFPEQSADLVTHLASWGYVVAAPDHVERSLSGLLGTAAQGVPRRDDPEVLAATLDLVLARATVAGPLEGMVDGTRVGVAGHSAGASAAYRLAATDERVDAFAAYSVGSGQGDRALPEPPAVPGLVMVGEDDGIIEPRATRAVFEAMEPPKYMASIADSGHLVFSDLCLIGAEQGGLVGIVERIGLPIPDDLLRLASDGCGEGALPVEEAFPAIDALSVAFFRAHLDEEVGAADALQPGPLKGLDGDAEVRVSAQPG